MNQLLVQTSWWVPLYGLIGAILTLPWSIGLVRRTGPRPAAYFNILMTVLALVHSALMLKAVWDQEPVRSLIPWLSVPDLDIWLTLETSRTSVAAALFITGLSLLAQIFALGYLEKDWALARFYALMGFFEAAMSGIALSDSLFLSYALLEMLTLSTYLLVGFWYAQPLVVTAARDAFLTKRVGDLLLLMGVVTLSTLAGSMDFTHLALWAENVQLPSVVATLLGLSLLAGPTGKCAQFPLNLWLDEAMEGPNPASILRNSVVVACGAYVLIKLQPVLALSPVTLTTIMVLGSLTAIGASLVSIAQIDIKRTLSHSTSAYLGLVFLAVGTQQDDLALMFLFAHGVAKALLFMSVGSIILTTSTQDLTEMGGLAKRMPATTFAYVVGGLASVALLPLGGFWAMVQWMEGVWAVSPWLVAVLLLVNGLTAFNLVRVFGLVFWGHPQPKTRRAPEVPWLMAVPMVTLSIFALLLPLLLKQWQLLPALSEVNLSLLASLLASGIGGAALAGIIYLNPAVRKPTPLVGSVLRDVLAYDFFIDRLYKLSVVFGVVQGSRLTAWFDRYVVDGLVNFVGVASIFSGESLKYTISGQSRSYLLNLFVGLLLALSLTGWLIWSPLF
ncbi:NAD(P)H-quinone oxidoreductase subunit F [Leptolyngbya sp. FACHB-711]|uniref:NAD(P)H-quinone oxidoreductase subunit F n=1 Tax=unclassified Leptolyngbya TaxID=2650499 RepID=UPI001681F1C7|nr:NAD(P)H-quinone oxidoreductase subunit F [Leptolyngbya sp. FACHB-711]MBD1850185.1 NAD(P)H-quinone oxidoreductase subunit F [Cyanobacteria bacterium FACHB-502]MBD2027710.1 NAD(P)H-quinone oxidoreductase subunit F [Leptolyngbya sp. FACHB-711]